MYEKKKSSWLKHLDFTILDIVCLEVAYFLSFLLRHGWVLNQGAALGKNTLNPFEDELYRQIAIVIVIVDLLVVFFRQTYKDIIRRGYFQEFKNVLFQNTCILGFMLAYLYVMQETADFSRGIFIATWVLGVFFMYGARLTWKRYIRRRLLKDENLPRVLLVVNKKVAEYSVNRIKNRRYNEFRLAGLVVLDENMTGQSIADEKVVADREGMFEYVLANVVDAVLLCGELSDMDRELITYRFLSMGQTVHMDLHVGVSDFPNKLIQQLGDFTVMTTSIKTADVRQLFIKRVMDIAGGLVGCGMMAVAAVIFAPIIFIQSPGPIFFTQTRVGKNGRTFKIYKFRSMYPDAEARKAELMKKNEVQGNMFKLTNDPRIIPIGNFIRKYSIDELPQFINILKGDMSLVGTRPPTVDEYEGYSLHHKVRLSIKPGLTGMWQVSGRSDIKNFDEVVRLDLKYIQEWNIGLDVKIILKTVAVVLGAKGSR